MSSDFPINNGQTWSQKVLAGDEIWAQVKEALDNAGLELPKTPRRPDVSLIVDNSTGQTIQFLNPGDHSGEKAENIPGTGDKCAAMIMLGGDTLDEQYANAKDLDEKYGLSEHGLTQEFAKAMAAESAAGVLLEAYGPAPFEGQASRLEPLQWGNSEVDPVISEKAAYGARAPEMETVMRSELAIFVQCEGKTAEKMEMEGMCIAVSSDWKTGEISTRPIVPSVAKDFYGDHFANMPVVEVDVEGNVASIDLKNGTPVLYLDDPYGDAPEFSHQGNGANLGQPS